MLSILVWFIHTYQTAVAYIELLVLNQRVERPVDIVSNILDWSQRKSIDHDPDDIGSVFEMTFTIVNLSCSETAIRSVPLDFLQSALL